MWLQALEELGLEEVDLVDEAPSMFDVSQALLAAAVASSPDGPDGNSVSPPEHGEWHGTKTQA